MPSLLGETFQPVSAAPTYTLQTSHVLIIQLLGHIGMQIAGKCTDFSINFHFISGTILRTPSVIDATTAGTRAPVPNFRRLRRSKDALATRLPAHTS